jgi:hypothetical protein
LLDVLHTLGRRIFVAHYNVITLVLRQLAPFDSKEVDCYSNSLKEMKSILIPASSSLPDWHITERFFEIWMFARSFKVVGLLQFSALSQWYGESSARMVGTCAKSVMGCIIPNLCVEKNHFVDGAAHIFQILAILQGEDWNKEMMPINW